MDDLDELAGSVERDPAGVAHTTTAMARHYRGASDDVGLSRAQAIAGRSWRMLGEIELAEQALGEAIAAAQRAGNEELEADAHLALAGVLSLSAGFHDAFVHLDDAVRLGSETVRGHAELQRAVLYRRAGRADEALLLFNAAVPRLRGPEDSHLDLARVLANRGGILLSAGDVGAAIADFEEAEELFASVGQGFAALQVRHNLACAVANYGDLPRALRLFDETCRGFEALGHDASVPLLSRAEALISAGLTADALDFSSQAVRRLTAEGNSSAAAEALVALAQAARMEGEYATAADAAGRAVECFASTGSRGWFGLAELELLAAEQCQGRDDPERPSRLASLADLLQATGNARAATLARVMFVESACRSGKLSAASSAASALRSSVGRGATVEGRLATSYTSALVALQDGDRPLARRQARKAVRVFDVSRSIVGAGAASTGDYAHRVATLALRIAAGERSAGRALLWMEHARRCGSVHRAALPPRSAELSAHLARLRVVAGELRQAELAGTPAGHLRHECARLERDIQLQALGQGNYGSATNDIATVGSLGVALRGGQLVSIGFDGERAVAVVVGHGPGRIVDLGPRAVLLEAGARAAKALRGLIAHGASSSVTTTHQRNFDAAIRTVDKALTVPLRITSDRVVFVVPAELHNLPWAALPSLSAANVTLAPSAGWWLHAATSNRRSTNDSVVTVAGPRMAEGELEARAVAAVHPKASVLTGADATVEAFGAALQAADVAHVVAHGRFRHDNPLWSSIELWDGMLTVYDIELLDRTPATVVLASCDSGMGGQHGGQQLLGLAQSMLSRGTTTIVAAVGALPDTPQTREVLVGLHRDMVAGIDPATALGNSRRADPASGNPTHWGLITLGVG